MAIEARHPQLDGLRCFAVLLVVWQHSGPPEGVRRFGLHGFGVYGVWLFFVLSAYLITDILLRERDRRDAVGGRLGRVLGTFYARRVLRIFPAYYLFLAVAVSLGAPMHEGELTSHVLYLSNWFMAIENRWVPVLTHLWSLAIEEQFYLVWPFVVLLTPRRRLPLVLVAAGVGALVFRIAVAAMPDASGIRFVVPTPASLDALAAGALLAWHRHARPEAAEARRRVLSYGFVLGCVLLVFAGLLGAAREYPACGIIEGLAGALLAVRVVDGGVAGFGGWTKRVLESRPVLFVGSVSYGVYLYHLLVIWMIARIGRPAAGTGAPSAWATSGTIAHLLLVLVTTVLLAALSFRLVERPLTALKRLVPYGHDPGARRAPESAETGAERA